MIIADAFSAMTMDRPYRAGMSYEEAFAELERGLGTQFDPNLVPIFVQAVRERLAHTPCEFRKAA
jgi:HD-GYP domain-containing protein (c-di-GMP phosphodiesterase class II)